MWKKVVLTAALVGCAPQVVDRSRADHVAGRSGAAGADACDGRQRVARDLYSASTWRQGEPKDGTDECCDRLGRRPHDRFMDRACLGAFGSVIDANVLVVPGDEVIDVRRRLQPRGDIDVWSVVPEEPGFDPIVVVGP